MKATGPPSLVKLGNESLICRQIRILKRVYPLAEIIVVGGHNADRVYRELPKGIKFVENQKYADTGVVRSVAAGLRVRSHDRVMLVYGDMVFDDEVLKGLYGKGSTLLLDSRGVLKDTEVGATAVGGWVTRLGYGLPQKWAGIAYFTGTELELLEKMARWQASVYSSGHEAINYVLKHGGSFRKLEKTKGVLAEIDEPSDIQTALAAIKGGLSAVKIQ